MFSWTGQLNRPIITAHRGYSALAPENTLAAFALAIEQGADAIELDVRCTADGEVVVFHDRTLDRTTEGRGAVRDMPYDQIREYSAGRWFGRSFAGERVPLLREVLELVDNRIGINIEVKEPPRGDRFDIIALCLGLIRRYHAHRIIMISSFHHPYVKRARQLEPRITGGILFHPVRNFRVRPSRLGAANGAQYFLCGKSVLRKRMVRDAHEHTMRAGVYTVNQSKPIDRLLRAGVDMIFTDDPVRIGDTVRQKLS